MTVRWSARPKPAPEPADPAARRASATLNAILHEVQLQTLAGIRVVDHGGIVVASTGEELGDALGGRDEVRKALLGEPVSGAATGRRRPAPRVSARAVPYGL